MSLQQDHQSPLQDRQLFQRMLQQCPAAQEQARRLRQGRPQLLLVVVVPLYLSMGNVVVRGGLAERFAQQDLLVLTLTSGTLNVCKYEIRIKVSSYHVHTSDVRLCLKLDSIRSNPSTQKASS